MKDSEPQGPIDISAFVDWRSITYGSLRPASRPQAWRVDAGCLTDILRGLRRELEVAVAHSEAIVDTYLYGGFTTESGDRSIELVALTEAMARAEWAGRSAVELPRFRELSTVFTVALDLPQATLSALYRARETTPNVRLRARGKICSCGWTATALELLGEGRDPDLALVCPDCRVTKLEFESPRQKLVDTLMASHVVRRAAELQGSTQSCEIVVISDDADALPAICASAAMGVRTKWIQTRPLRKYGYRELAKGMGVEILEVGVG